MVFYEHRHPGMSLLNHELLKRNRLLMTEEVNAAVRGSFDAGAGRICRFNDRSPEYDYRLYVV